MNDPRCSRTGLLLYILYITSFGLLQCASSSCSSNNRDMKYVFPGPVSPVTSDPWSQQYITNPNILFKTKTPTEISNQHIHYLSPEERTMTQVERIALKKTPGNYMYPEIPQLHKTPVHACLAGYDGEIFAIIRDIKQTNGDEIDVHFYLFHRCKFNLLSSHMTTVKALQDVLTKYHHYICLNKKYVETYKAKEHCWYIEKLIMIPSFTHNFKSLPHDMEIDDFNKEGFEPLVLRTEEKVNPGENIKKIEEYENRYELTLHDLSGMVHGGNAEANLNGVCYPTPINKYIPNLLPEQVKIPTAIQPVPILPVKEELNLSNRNNQITSYSYGAYSKKSSTYNQARSYTQTQGQNNYMLSPSSFYAEHGTSQNSAGTVARYPAKSIGAYQTVPIYTAYSSSESPYQMTSTCVASQTDAKQRQNIKSYYQPSISQQNNRILGLNALPKPSNEKVVLGQTVQRYPTGVSYTQSGENLIHGNWSSRRIASAGYQTQPAVTFSPIYKEKHDHASYSVSQSQFQPNYVTPYYSKSQNYNQQSYNKISSYTSSPKVQILPTPSFVTTNRNFQRRFYDKLPQKSLEPDNNVVSLKPNKIKDEEITFSLHSHAHVSNSPSSGLNIFYSPQPNVVSNDKTDIFNERNAYSPKKLVNPEYTTFTSSKVNPTVITPLVCNVKPLNNFVSPITQNVVNTPKYTQPWAQPQKYTQMKYRPVSVPPPLNIVPFVSNNRLVQATYQARSPCIMTPKIWSPSPKLYTVEYSKPSTPILSEHTTVYSSASNKIPWYSTHLNKNLPDYQSIPFYSPIQNDLSLKTYVNQINNGFDSNNKKMEAVIPLIQPHLKSDDKYNTISTYTPRSVVKPTFNVDNVVSYTNNNNNKQSIVSSIGYTDSTKLKWPHTVVTHPTSKSYLQALSHVNLNQPAPIQIPYLPNYQNKERVWPNYQTIRPSITIKASYETPELNEISSYIPRRVTPVFNTISTQATTRELKTPQFQTIASYRPAQKPALGYKVLPYTPFALDSQIWSKSTSPKYKWPTKTFNSIESYTKAPIKLDNDLITSYNPSTQYNEKYDNVPSYTQPLYNAGTQQYKIASNIQPRTYEQNIFSSYTPAIKIKTPSHKLQVTSQNNVESVLLMPRPSVVAENVASTVCSPSGLNYKQNVDTIPYYIPRRETLERQFPTEKLSYEPSHKFVSPDHGTKINYGHSQTTKMPNLNIISSYTQPLAPIPNFSPVPYTSLQNIWNKPKYETISHYMPYRSNALRVEPISYFKPLPNIVGLGPITVSHSTQNQPKYEPATILTPNIAICKHRLNTFKLLAPKIQPVIKYHNTNSIPNYKQHQNYFTHKIPSWGSLTPVINQGPIASSIFDPNLNVISSYTSQLKPNIVNFDVPPQSSRITTLDLNKIESYKPICRQKGTSLSSQVPFERQPSYDVPHAPTQNQFRQICNTISAYTPQREENRPVAYTQQAMNVIPKYSTIALDIPEEGKPEHGKISYTYASTSKMPFTPIQMVKPELLDIIPSYSRAKNIQWPNLINPSLETVYQPEFGTKTIPLAKRVQYSSNAINSWSKVIKPNIHNQPLNIAWRAGPIYQPVQTHKLRKVKYPEFDMINAYTRPKQVINQGSDSLKKDYPVERPTQPLQVQVDSKPRNEQTILQPEYDMLSSSKLPQVVKPKYDEIRFYSPKKLDSPSYQVLTPDALRTQVSNTVISYTPHLKTVQRALLTEHTHIHYTPTQTTNLHDLNNLQMQKPLNEIDLIQSYTSKPDTFTGVTGSRTLIDPNILQPLSQIGNLQPLDNTKQHFNVIPCYTEPQSYIRGYKLKYPGKSNEKHFTIASNMPNLVSIPSYTPRPIKIKPDYISLPMPTPIIIKPSTVLMPSSIQWPKTYQQTVNIISKPTQKLVTKKPNFVSVLPISQILPSTHLLEGVRPCAASLSPQNHVSSSKTPDLISIPSYTPRPTLTRPHLVSIPSYTPRPPNLSPDLVTVSPLNPEVKIPDALVSITSYTKPPTSDSYLKLPYTPINIRPEFVKIPQYKLWPESKRPDIVSIPSYNPIPSKISPDMLSISTYTPRPISVSPNIMIPKYTLPVRSNIDIISSYTERPKSTRLSFAPISSYPNNLLKPVTFTARPTNIQQNFVSIPKYTPIPTIIRPISVPVNPYAQQTNEIPSYSPRPTNKIPNLVTISSYTQTPTRVGPDLISIPSYSAKPISTLPDLITITPSIRTSANRRLESYSTRPLQPSYIARPKYENVIPSYSQPAVHISTASSIPRPHGISPKPDVIPWYNDQTPINQIQRPNTHQPYSQIPYGKLPKLDVISPFRKRPDLSAPSSYQPDGKYPCYQRPCSINPYTRSPTDISPELNVIPNYSKRPDNQHPLNTRPVLTLASAYRHRPNTATQHVVSIPSYTQESTKITLPCAKRVKIDNPVFVSISKPQHKTIIPRYNSIRYSTLPNVNVLPFYTKRRNSDPQPNLVSYPKSKSTQTIKYAPASGNWITKGITPDFYQIKSYTKPGIPSSQIPLISANLHNPSLKSFDQIVKYTPYSLPSQVSSELFIPSVQPCNQIASYTKPCIPILQSMKLPEQLFSPSEQPHNQIGSYRKPCVPILEPIKLPEQLYSPLEKTYNQIESYTKPCVPTLQPSVQSPRQLTSSTKPIEKSFTKLLYRASTHQKKLPDYNSILEYSNNPTGFKDACSSFALYRTPITQYYKNIPLVSPNSETINSFEKPIDQKVQYDRITSYISPCKKLSYTRPYIQINKYTEPNYENINLDKQSLPQYIKYTKPCVPPTQPCVPCVPNSNRPRETYVPTSNRPRETYVPPSNRPREAYVPTSNQPCISCVPVSYQPCIPYVPTSNQPRVPCVPLVYQPRYPCVLRSYQHVPCKNVPDIPCVPSIPRAPISYQGISCNSNVRPQQQLKNTFNQDFDNVLLYRTPDCKETLKNVQHNNVRNETNIDVNSMNNCVMNAILKAAKGDISCLKSVIPLDRIVLGVANKFKDKIPFFSHSIDPNVELRGFIKKVKILKPKLVFETEEIEIPNFVPVVKCHDERHPDLIQNMAADFIKSTYKNPLIVNKTHPFVMVKNWDISPDSPLIWPAVCEFGNSCQRCSRSSIDEII